MSDQFRVNLPEIPDLSKNMENLHREMQKNMDEYRSYGIFERIEDQIKDFEASLPPDSFVAVHIPIFGLRIRLISIQFDGPTLIIFHGLGENTDKIRIIQHIHQINFILTSGKLEKATDRKPIGFEVT